MPKKAAALFLIGVSLATWISCGKTTSHYLYGAIPAANAIDVYREDPNSGLLIALSFSPVSAGQGVQSLALNPSGTFLYAANSGESDVSQFAINSDGSLSEQGARMQTGGSDPTVLAMDKAGAYLYVMNAGTNNISAFSIASSGGTLAAVTGSPFPLGFQPSNMALSPAGSVLYVAGQGSLGGVVEAFSLSSGVPTFVGSFATGSFPNGLAIPPNGSYLYVSNTQSNSISEFMIASDGSLSQLQSSPFGEAYQSPTWLFIDKTGTYLYVANEGSSNLAAYTIGSGGALTALSNTVSPIATGTQPNLIAADPNNEYLFVGNQSTPVIQSFALDSGNGALTSVESYKVAGTPTSIVIVP